MKDNDRTVAYLTGRPVDRPPFWIFWGPWATTLKRWRSEGMPADVERTGLARHFGADLGFHAVQVNCGPCPRFERTVLEESDQYVTFIDSWGIKRRDYKGGMSMSQFLEFPVKTREDWERFKAERLNPDDGRRLDGQWLKCAADHAAAGGPVQLGYFPDVGIFGTLRWLLGDEECLLAFYTEPRLVREIMEHMTDLYLTVFAKVVGKVRVDVIHLWEDMCGRQGPLISPAHFEEFMAPCYRRIRRFADEHGIPLMSVDTDGQPDLVTPPMMRNGVNYLWPFEAAAGADVNVFRRKYPELAMMGGIDKRALAHGRAAIDAELARIRPAFEKGRYIPELDHLVPDDVSWENYCHYVEQLRKMVLNPP
ncbi:MAG: uroporphyrinogen decarboxylase family protein [Phycisphaerae bacterium]